MASTSIASGIHSLGAHSALRNQNEGLCCLRRSLHDHARFARGFLQQYNSCCSNLQLGGKNPTLLNATSNEDQPANDDEKGNDPSSADDGFFQQASQDSFRKNLENMIGADDESFCGKDLAMLIRNKYGRSYDVQLIKKEFMGRQLLAMNVMWKYREQRSFPLTEEEYLLRLDDVANNLRCWGAVSYVRSSLAKTKERPRIGKAVSIFIDLDESGGRANEWIYR